MGVCAVQQPKYRISPNRAIKENCTRHHERVIRTISRKPIWKGPIGPPQFTGVDRDNHLVTVSQFIQQVIGGSPELLMNPVLRGIPTVARGSRL